MKDSEVDRHFETQYLSLPILSASDLPIGITIVGKIKWDDEYQFNQLMNPMEKKFLHALDTALLKPEWLLNLEGIPRKGVISRRFQISGDFYKAIMEAREGYAPFEYAHQINIGRALNIYADTIVVRALELMCDDYPNLTFTRGHEFDIDQGIVGYDFSWGNLPDAIDFALTQPHPTIAMLSFRALVQGYKNGDIDIATEHNWYRDSLEIHMPQEKKRDSLSLYRLPEGEEALKELLNDFKKKSVHVD